MPTIGFIGVGRIGEPMVERLIAAGHDVWCHARRAEVVHRLELLGAYCVAAPADLGSRDVVISCLYSDAEMLDVAPEMIDSMMPGSIFVSHTTGTTMALEELAVIARNRSVGIVDAGFSGTSERVREGTLTLFLGGATADVDRAKEVLKAYGSLLLDTGDLGSGMRVKVLNNLLFAAISQSTLSVLKSASRMGIDETSLLRALQAGSGASAAAEMIRTRGGADPFIQRVEPFMRKDVDVAARMATAMNVDLTALLAAASTGPMNLTPPGDHQRESDVELVHLTLKNAEDIGGGRGR
jgi:3-hydroxyisobutyrate dehydrogenase-like beta-hydroxyacid dehydrogenase